MAKIMLVEDDKSLREIYSIRLVAEGYDIVSAGDGEEALGLAVQEKPDLIVADVMMPKISGFDMLDILRSTPETSKIKVIMMTALSSDDQRRRGEQLGAERYLVKSQVGIEDVINAVHEVLGDKANSSAQANLDTVAAVPAKAAATTQQPVQPTPVQTVATPAQTPTPAITGTPTAAATPAITPAAATVTPAAATMPTTAVVPAAAPATPAATPAPAAVPATATAPTATPAQAIAAAAPVAQAVAPVATAPMATTTSTTTSPTAASSATINAPAATPVPVTNPAPAQASIGERVIQPIHDPRVDESREEMQRRMAEMLGNENNIAPRQITTKTAEDLTREAEEQARAEAAQKALAARQAAAQAQVAAAAQKQAQNAVVQAAPVAAQVQNPAVAEPVVAPIQPAYETALQNELKATNVDQNNPVAVQMAKDLQEGSPKAA